MPEDYTLAQKYLKTDCFSEKTKVCFRQKHTLKKSRRKIKQLIELRILLFAVLGELPLSFDEYKVLAWTTMPTFIFMAFLDLNELSKIDIAEDLVKNQQVRSKHGIQD